MRYKNGDFIFDMFKLFRNYGFAINILLLCILWYMISSTSSIVNKITLQKYPYPLTVSLVALLSVPLCSTPVFRIWHIYDSVIPSYYLRRYVIPISIGKVLAVVSAYVSVWKMPVSFAQTVKATMPLFAVVSARFILHEHQTMRVYLSLLPIMAGVIIATITELSFDFIGLISALISTGTYSVLNVFVKKVLEATEVHPLRLLVLNSQIAAYVFFPFWFLYDGISFWSDLNDVNPNKSSPFELSFLFLLILCGVLSFAQNLCAFTLIHKLSALSYAVTNATKRITVISASLLTLNNPVTYTNVFGMSLAVFGVFLYNQAKQFEKDHGRLPKTRTDLTMSDASLVLLDVNSHPEI